jgi:hypothetical protein
LYGDGPGGGLGYFKEGEIEIPLRERERVKERGRVYIILN